MIGDFLFALSARDQQLTPLEVVHRRVDVAAAAAVSLSTDLYTVPTDRQLLIASLYALATAGAAQLAYYVRFYYSETGVGQTRDIAAFNFPSAAAALATAGSFPGGGVPLIVPPSAVVGAQGVFSAGGAANAMTVQLHGILIPRGNVSI